MSKEAYYFSHDSNARHDPKIAAMRSEYGIAGYGVYWVIIEMLREQDNFMLPNKEYIYNAIAMQVQCKAYAKDDAKRFVESCINEYDLLQRNDQFIWSNSLLKRMQKRDNLSEKRRAAAKARWEKPNDTNDLTDDFTQTDANAMQKNANAMQTDAIKGKEKKRNKIKDINNNISAIEIEFDDFWSAYPRKLDKKKAFEKFKSAAKNHDPQIIIQGAINYAKQCEAQRTEKNFIKHPTTFLNAESFLNDFDISYSKGGQARTGVVKKSLFEQGPESRARQAEAEARASDKEIDWEKELEDLPY